MLGQLTALPLGVRLTRDQHRSAHVQHQLLIVANGAMRAPAEHAALRVEDVLALACRHQRGLHFRLIELRGGRAVLRLILGQLREMLDQPGVAAEQQQQVALPAIRRQRDQLIGGIQYP